MVVAHEANRTAGFGAQVIARATESLSREMRISAVRVALPDVRMPASPELQGHLMLAAADVQRAVLNVTREA